MRRLLMATFMLLLGAVPAQADTAAQLLSRVNEYFSDSSNAVIDTATKNRIINVALQEYTRAWPVQIDTASQAVTAGTRIYALPANCGDVIISVHKQDDKFTELKYVPTDSVPAIDGDVLQLYSVSGRYLLLYPLPNFADAVFYFYNRVSPTLDSSAHECELHNSLEEPIVLLAVSKLWQMTDLRLDLAEFFYRRYEAEAARLLHLKLEERKAP